LELLSSQSRTRNIYEKAEPYENGSEGEFGPTSLKLKIAIKDIIYFEQKRYKAGNK